MIFVTEAWRRVSTTRPAGRRHSIAWIGEPSFTAPAEAPETIE
jgi:hypothetical protein